MDLSLALKDPTIKSMHKELFSVFNSGSYSGTAEFLHKSIFSTINITAADVTASRKSWRFFDPNNQTVTVDETNINGSQLPKGQKLSAYTIQLEVYRTAGDNATVAQINALLNFMFKTYAEYHLDNKAVMWDGSLARIAGLSIGAMGAEPTGIAPIETFRAISNGNFTLKVPLVIEELTTFFFNITTPLTIDSNLAGWSFRVFLDGGFIRGL